MNNAEKERDIIKINILIKLGIEIPDSIKNTNNLCKVHQYLKEQNYNSMRPIIVKSNPNIKIKMAKSNIEGVSEYVRKPDTFEAIQFTGSNQKEISEFTGGQFIPIEGEKVMKFNSQYSDAQYLYESQYVIKNYNDFIIKDRRAFNELYNPHLD